MSLHKITITASGAEWFTVELENNASWVLPKDQMLVVKTTEGSMGAFRIDANEVEVEAMGTVSSSFNLELFAETTEANLAVVAEQAGGTVTVNSSVDQHTTGLQRENYMLRLT